MAKCKQKTHKASSKVLTKKKNGTLTYKNQTEIIRQTKIQQNKYAKEEIKVF
jgi:hypothetical protein